MSLPDSPSLPPLPAREVDDSQSSSFSLAQLLLLVVACGTFLALAKWAFDHGNPGKAAGGTVLAGLLAGGVVGTIRAMHYDLSRRSIALGAIVGIVAGGCAAMLLEAGIGKTVLLVGCGAMLLVSGGTRFMSRRGGEPQAAADGISLQAKSAPGADPFGDAGQSPDKND